MGSWNKHLRSSLSDAGLYDVPPSKHAARLHANEAGWEWPREVIEALLSELRAVELNRYPDTSARNLRGALAKRLGCDSERIVVGNGSAEIVGLFYALLCGTKSPVLVVPVPAFAMFANSGRAYGYEVREVPLQADLQLNLPAMRKALRGATLCVIARPNNPTGSLYDAQLIHELVAEFPDTVFIIDEVYGDYAPGSSLLHAKSRENQVFLGSLSKIGLAAVRIGYCVAEPALARALDKVRMPYNVPQTSIALAEAVLRDHGELLETMTRKAIDRRESMRTTLRRMPGATVHSSHANMVLVSFRDRQSAANMQRALGGRGVHVRDVSDEVGFAEIGLVGCLRVSVGSDAELELLARAIDDLRFGTALPLT